MRTLEVVRCTNTDHRMQCMREAANAVERAMYGPVMRNGRKVTIRGEITDPCACHLDALIWMTVSTALNRPSNEKEMHCIFSLGQLLTRLGIIK